MRISTFLRQGIEALHPPSIYRQLRWNAKTTDKIAKYSLPPPQKSPDWNIFAMRELSSSTPLLQSLRTIVDQKLICFYPNGTRCSPFVRDSHVALNSGKTLVPYPIKRYTTSALDLLLMSMIPIHAGHFFASDVPIKGIGFTAINVMQAMATAADFGLCIKQGKTCIEGGNCYVFFSHGQPKAIVGELSLYLSMIALEEQGLLDDAQPLPPSSESYRIARNMDLFSQMTHYVEAETLSDFNFETTHTTLDLPLAINKDAILKMNAKSSLLHTLASPASEQDREQYESQASLIEAKLSLTKQCVAEDLEVPLKDITFLPQTTYHIDMELFVMPDGTVILHDAKKTEELLDKISQEGSFSFAEADLLYQYRRQTAKDVIAFSALQKQRLSMLSAQNIDVHTMPAVLKDGQVVLNYCNGIFVPKRKTVFSMDSCEEFQRQDLFENGYTFITTGPTTEAEHRFHNKIFELFQKKFPSMTMRGIANMSEFIARRKGGIRCLTFEAYPPVH